MQQKAWKNKLENLVVCACEININHFISSAKSLNPISVSC